MSIQVAQLSILVNADTSQAASSLNSLNAAFAQVAQQAVQGAATASGSQQQVVAAIQQVVAATQEQTAAIQTAEQNAASAVSAVVFAVRNQTAAMQEGAATAGTAATTLSNNVRQVGTSVNGMGSVGARGVMMLSQSFAAAGQSLGSLQAPLYMVSSQLMVMPTQASTASKAVYGIAIALSAIGAAAAALGAPQIQQLANLKAALADGGHDWNDYSASIQTAIDKGAGWGQTQSKVTASLAQLAAIVKDPTQLLYAYQVSADVAARRNIDLKTATDIVVRGMEGQSRGLRVLGIDMTLVAHPADTLKKAQEALVNVQETLTNRTDAYHAALQRYQDGLAIAALKADTLARANETLATTQQHLTDLQAKFAAEDMVQTLSHQEQAVRSLADAQQSLADVQRKALVDAEQPSIDKVADATDRLALATQRLKEIQDRQAAAQAGSPDDLNRLAAASQRVLDTQQRLADAQGAGIVPAQQALRAAIDEQRKALDAQAQKQLDAISNTSSLMSAQDEVKRSTQELARVQQEAYLESIGETPKQVQQQIELRNALDKVADAQRQVGIAASQDTSEAALKALSRANELRDANTAIVKAIEGVSQAHKDAEIAAIHQRDAFLTVVSAQDAMITAQGKVAEATNKVALAQQAVLDQATKVLDAIHEKTKGTADGMANTWAGTLKRWKTDFENFLGDFGTGVGKWLTFLAPVVFVVSQLKNMLTGGAAAAGAGEAVAVGGGGILEGLAGVVAFLTGVGEVAAVVAAIGGSIYILNKHWDDFKMGLKVIGQDVTHAFDTLWGNFKTGVSVVGSSIASFFASIPGRIANAVSADTSLLYRIGHDLISAMFGGITAGYQAVGSFFMGISSRITGALEGLPRAMLNIGHNMMQGLWDGIQSVWNGVMQGGQSLVSMVGGLPGRLIGVLGIHSPSTVFRSIGENIMLGLHEGIMNHAQAPANALLDISKKMAATPFKVNVQGVGAVSSGSGVGGSVVFIQNIDARPTLNGNLIHERDLAFVIQDALVKAGRRQGGNLFNGTIR